MSRRVLLGRISGAHGLKGEVRIQTYTSEPEAISAYGPLFAGDGGAQITLERVRPAKGGAVIAAVAGVRDRDAAEALRGLDLFAGRDSLPAPEEDEFYHADLIGLAAVTSEGERIGEIVAVQNFGAGDLLEIRLDGGRRTEFAPFTQTHAPVVDIGAGRVMVILPRPDESGG
ncbi:MAG: ribosome maturation factor RimM [Hyphomicrobiales bacterium]|nr:ribosome maturation factor RimM [Hyphomicrobiales bacterium]